MSVLARGVHLGMQYDARTAEVDRMLRRLVFSVAAVAMMYAGGCASSRPTTTTRHTALKPYLLFDRYAGVTAAADARLQSDWPSSFAGYTLEERVEFTEWFQDRQGQNTRNDNEFYRRFTTLRTGVIQR